MCILLSDDTRVEKPNLILTQLMFRAYNQQIHPPHVFQSLERLMVKNLNQFTNEGLYDCMRISSSSSSSSSSSTNTTNMYVYLCMHRRYIADYGPVYQT